MTSVSVSEEFAGTVHAAETCWYDTAGWPDWVDGLDHVEEVVAPWPAAGGWIRWRSGPAGRGEVTERATEYQALSGQTADVADQSIEAQQRVSFSPADEEHVTVTLTLDYRLRRRTRFTPVVDRLFIRPAMRRSLQATLTRFGHRLRVSQQ